MSPWRGAGPELAIAAAAAAAGAAAAYAVAGLRAFAVAAVVTAAVALVTARALPPGAAPEEARTFRRKPAARPLVGYEHRRFLITTAASSAGFYEKELRPALEHVLAARLAERRGVNLYHEPEAASRDAAALLGPALWAWIDPAQQAARQGRQISRRTLARLIDRLEQL
jgi:hypothetical protein